MTNTSSKVLNYFKLQLLLTRSYVILRQLFKNRYSQFDSGAIWDDSPTCGTSNVINVLVKNKKIPLRSAERTSISHGDSSEWDLTILITLLLYMDRPKTLSPTEIQQLDHEGKLLEELKRIRNELVHDGSKSIDDTKFHQLWTNLSRILVTFGDVESELDKLKDDSVFDSRSQTINEENVKEASRLNSSGTQAHKEKKFSEAITLFTKATVLSGVSDHDRALFYSNMSSSRLALYEQQQEADPSEEYELINVEDQRCRALRDAKQARKLWPTWWKGHFRVGKVYTTLNEHEKAINSFERAFALSPINDEIQKALDDSRSIRSGQSRQEHLDPRLARGTTSGLLNEAQQKLGVDPPKLRFRLSFLRKVYPSGADVVKGHQYAYGDTDVKQDYEQAAKYYAKAANQGNAEGIYNLACLTDRGLGVKKDHNLAHKLYEQAAAQSPKHPLFKTCRNVGVAEAEHALGLRYAEGIVVHKIPPAVAYWYQRAIEHGSAGSANNLAIMYEDGVGVDQNLNKAEELFELAANRGDPNAMLRLAELSLTKRDVQMANIWHDRACEAGNMVAQTNRSEFETILQVEQQLLDKCPSNILKTVNVTKNICDLQKLYKTVCTGTDQAHTYDYDVLNEYAQRGSKTAKIMCSALEHFMQALSIIIQTENLTEELENEFVHELSQCYRLEHIVAQIPGLEMRQRINKIVDRVLQRCNSELNASVLQLDEDVRICYTILHMDSFELISQFLSQCIQKYPKSIYFYDLTTSVNGWLGQYDAALYEANRGLEINPNYYDLLYFRAVALRLIDTDMIETIEAYQVFLNTAPNDHRYVPESYYAMGACYFLLDEDEDVADIVYETYKQGEEAEKLQLPCFVPYESNSKALVNGLLDSMETLRFAPPFHSELQTEEKIQGVWNENTACSEWKYRVFGKGGTKRRLPDPVSVPDTEPTAPTNRKQRLTNPQRIEVIVKHREWEGRILQEKCNPQSHQKSYNEQPRIKQQTAKSLIGLKPISIREMNPTTDHVYDGYVLSVTIIEEAYTWSPSIHLVVEDEDLDCERMYIHGFSDTQGKYLINEVYTIGNRMHIINPYLQIGAHDMKSTIRIDDCSSIIMQNKSERVLNMCRCCGEANVPHACSKCHQARYCNRECQTMDWEIYKHKLICKNNS